MIDLRIRCESVVVHIDIAEWIDPKLTARLKLKK